LGEECGVFFEFDTYPCHGLDEEESIIEKVFAGIEISIKSVLGFSSLQFQ
jgi:hypothetical protein